MSKASEWARRYEAQFGPTSEAPSIWLIQRGMRHGSQQCVVGGEGDLWMGGYSLPPEEALRLARWILDTFGEEDAK